LLAGRSGRQKRLVMNEGRKGMAHLRKTVILLVAEAIAASAVLIQGIKYLLM
jgi:hypothetical protein